MPVNANKSGSRLLAVVEQIARLQPIGVRALAKSLEVEKSAVQRAVTTLSEAGWIQSRGGLAGQWELSGRILHVAHLAHGSNSLRQRVRPIPHALRDQTGETVYLAIPDVDGFVVMEVAESRLPLRLVVPVGVNLSGTDSEPARAVLPHFDIDQRQRFGFDLPGEAATSSQACDAEGYCLTSDPNDETSLSIASAVFDVGGQVVGALVISAVRSRTSAADQARHGALLAAASRKVSSFDHTEFRPADLHRAIGSFG